MTPLRHHASARFAGQLHHGQAWLLPACMMTLLGCTCAWRGPRCARARWWTGRTARTTSSTGGGVGRRSLVQEGVRMAGVEGRGRGHCSGQTESVNVWDVGWRRRTEPPARPPARPPSCPPSLPQVSLGRGPAPEADAAVRGVQQERHRRGHVWRQDQRGRHRLLAPLWCAGGCGLAGRWLGARLSGPDLSGVGRAGSGVASCAMCQPLCAMCQPLCAMCLPHTGPCLLRPEAEAAPKQTPCAHLPYPGRPALSRPPARPPATAKRDTYVWLDNQCDHRYQIHTAGFSYSAGGWGNKRRRLAACCCWRVLCF